MVCFPTGSSAQSLPASSSGGGSGSSSVPDACSVLHQATLSELASLLKASLQWEAQEGIVDFGFLGDQDFLVGWSTTEAV